MCLARPALLYLNAYVLEVFYEQINYYYYYYYYYYYSYYDVAYLSWIQRYTSTYSTFIRLVLVMLLGYDELPLHYEVEQTTTYSAHVHHK